MLRVKADRAEVRRTYSALSRFYGTLEGRFEAKQRRILLDLLALCEGDRVVEVGVGTGFGLEEIGQRTGERGMACGVDLTPEMIALAQRRVRRAGLHSRVRLVEGDARALPFRDRLFDAAFLLSTLELFDTPDIPRVLAEIRRVLKPAGRIAVGSLSREGHERSIAVRVYEWFHRKMPKYASCRPIYVEQAAADAGFEVTAVREMRAGGVLPVKLLVARARSAAFRP